MSVTVSKNQIFDILETVFDKQSTNRARFFHQLQQTRRVQNSFHCTLIHRASAKQHPEIWEKYSAIHEAAGSAENKLGDCRVQLERVSDSLCSSHYRLMLSLLALYWQDSLY
jgi:tRNA ligase